MEPIQKKLQFVLKDFAIKPTDQLTVSFFSQSNEVFFVPTEFGTLVLKNNLKNNEQKLLEEELLFSQYLTNNNCPTPEIVAAKDGRLIVDYNNEQLFTMTRFVDGIAPNLNDTMHKWHFKQAAIGLARFHNASRKYTGKFSVNRIKSWDFSGYQKAAQQLVADTKKLVNKRKSAKLMLPVSEKLLQMSLNLEKQLTPDLLNSCETLIIHGDFHPYNCFFKDEKFTACCDFDFTRFDLKSYDLFWFTWVMVKHYYYARECDYQDQEIPFLPEDTELITDIYTRALEFVCTNYMLEGRLYKEDILALQAMEMVRNLNFSHFFNYNNSEEECLFHLSWLEFFVNNEQIMLDCVQQSITNVLQKLNLPSNKCN